MMKKPQGPVDLVEFQYDHAKKAFVKKETHVRNVARAIAYGKKRAIEFLRPTSKYTRFRVVPNGSLEHTNQFKPTRNGSLQPNN